MGMERSILHINICHFYTAVACIQAPRLSGYPVAVRAPGSRRVLLDVSSEAWKAGVSRGMTFEAAKRLCPDLVLLDPAPDLYERIDRTIFDQACTLSPQVERAGPGHVFVDLSGTTRLLGRSSDIADRLRLTIRDACRIEPAVGVAANRLVSKIATRVAKPTGFCTVVTGCEEEFIAPLPIGYLPGIERQQLEQLRQFNLYRIGEITQLPAPMLATVIGAAAYDICQRARGIDVTPVRQAQEAAPQVKECEILAEPTNDDTLLSNALFRLVALAGASIRKQQLAVGRISITIRYADGAEAAKSLTIDPPVSGDLTLFRRCRALFEKLMIRRVRVTELTLTCTHLSFPYGQTDLFDGCDREEPLMAALDSIRTAYGRSAINFWSRKA